MEQEIWLPVKGYENLYEISSSGKVRSIDRIIKRELHGVETNFKFKGKLLKTRIGKNGYYVTSLSHAIKVYIHRLVAEAFIPNPESKPCINHIDHNRQNNNIDNLEWCTYLENNRHSKHKKVKRVEVLEIRNLYKECIYNQYELADIYKVSQSAIWSIVNNKSYSNI